MSKVTKRKITVESPSHNKPSNSNISNSTINKESQRRQSVFERLGTKTGASILINANILGQQPPSSENFCRHWNQNGTCPYGKSCVFVNSHTLISPSKRVPKKDLDTKQALARSLEEGLKLEGLKRLHSTVVKRGSPDLNWESWDQTDLEYEDEKVLEKRRQLLQRELELQMKREETEEHYSRRRHTTTKSKKGLSSSSSTSVSSTSSDTSSSSDDSSTDSSSTSGIARESKRKNKAKKSKRRSSSVSDSERKKIRNTNKSMHKDRSPSNLSRKSNNSKDKRAFTPPRKSAPNTKMAGRKKSPSPSHRRHNTPTATSASSKSKPSTSKSSSGSRHNLLDRPGSKRSTSLERKDKHKRSLSPRSRSKTTKERSPRRQDSRSRRKDSPETKPRNTSRSRQLDSRLDDRKKEEDRSRNKDDRRQDRKPGTDRDKRDHEDARAREKTREAAREKEREEALERCRERQRERELLAKDKDRPRERPREDRDKDTTRRDYDKPVSSLLSTHTQPDRKISDRDRDRSTKDRKDRDKERDKDRDRERPFDRNLEKSDRRPLEKERIPEKTSERDRANEKDNVRPRERDNINERARDKNGRDRSFEKDRNFDRSANEPLERNFDRDKDRKGLDRSRDKEFDRDKDRSNYDRIPDNRRSFEKVGDKDRTSLERDRGMIRDRGIDRVLELRERNKSLERGRASDGERSVDRNRERFDREARFERRALPEDKNYDNSYDPRRDRGRYGDNADRAGMFKDMSPPREDVRGMRHQGFGGDRRNRGGRGGWEGRNNYDDSGSMKQRDWDYSDSRRDWEARNQHGEWEGGVEGEDWGRYGEWGGGDWREDWQQHRPPRHPARDDQTIVSSNHIVVRDANGDDISGRRPQVMELSDKDPAAGDFKKENADICGIGQDSSGKRGRDDGGEGQSEVKKPRLDEALPSVLEEALSDISDDPDEILNREDVDMTLQDSAMVEDDIRTSASAQATSQELDQRMLEDRPSEEENIDNLDFEEISDEELEEEARANKGLGDALGVDWASLVKETRPEVREVEPGAARRRWQPLAILARIGVSKQYAGEDVYNEIQQQLADANEGEEGKEEKSVLLHPVAFLHKALKERQARRKSLFSSFDTYKRALSARTDLAIRRQLCNLPVDSLEIQQSAGFCQLVV